MITEAQEWDDLRRFAQEMYRQGFKDSTLEYNGETLSSPEDYTDWVEKRETAVAVVLYLSRNQKLSSPEVVDRIVTGWWLG